MTSKPRAVAAMVRYIHDRVIKKGMRLLLLRQRREPRPGIDRAGVLRARQYVSQAAEFMAAGAASW